MDRRHMQHTFYPIFGPFFITSSSEQGRLPYFPFPGFQIPLQGYHANQYVQGYRAQHAQNIFGQATYSHRISEPAMNDNSTSTTPLLEPERLSSHNFEVRPSPPILRIPSPTPDDATTLERTASSREERDNTPRANDRNGEEIEIIDLTPAAPNLLHTTSYETPVHTPETRHESFRWEEEGEAPSTSHANPTEHLFDEMERDQLPRPTVIRAQQILPQRIRSQLRINLTNNLRTHPYRRQQVVDVIDDDELQDLIASTHQPYPLPFAAGNTETVRQFDECPICLEIGRKPFIKLHPCHHCLHQTCGKRWWTTRRRIHEAKCPLCRTTTEWYSKIKLTKQRH